MEYISAIPFGSAMAFYRICETYSKAFLATLEKYTGAAGHEAPPASVFFIKEENSCLGDVTNMALIEKLVASIDTQDQHQRELLQL